MVNWLLVSSGRVVFVRARQLFERQLVKKANNRDWPTQHNESVPSVCTVVNYADVNNNSKLKLCR